MYSDLKRKKAKQNNSSQNCMGKINGKKKDNGNIKHKTQ